MKKSVKFLVATVFAATLACAFAACDQGHTHVYDYDNLQWNWAEDYSSASASVSCAEDEETLTEAATVSQNTVPAELGVQGYTEYTATVVIDGVTYTDSVRGNYEKYRVATPEFASAEYNEGAALLPAELDGAPYEIAGETEEITLPGNYTFTLRLKDGVNNRWADTDEDTVTVSFTVGKKTIEAASDLEIEAAVYDGTAKTPVLKNDHGGLFALDTSGETYVDAGSYEVTVVLADTEKYQWASDGKVTFTIDKAEVDASAIAIAAQTYTGSPLTPVLDGDALYELDGANSFTDAGTHEVTLRLKNADNYKWKNDINTVSFTVNKATENSVSVTAPDDIKCHGTPVDPEIVSATFGGDSATFVYSAAENGTFKPLDELDEGFFTASGDTGTYFFVKAVVAETDNFAGATSEAVSFKVDHDHVWQTTGETEDKKVCACGDVGGTFVKTVTVSNQDLLVTESSSTLSLDGVSTYASIKSVTYKTYDLGKSLTVTLPDELKTARQEHGKGNLTVVVVGEDGAEHTVTVAVTVVTQAFSNWTEVLAFIDSFKDDQVLKDGTTTIDYYAASYGYYILKNDINGVSGNSGAFNSSASDMGAYSSDWNRSDLGDYGFRGTLDGRNYELTFSVARTPVLIPHLGSGSLIRDITINNVNGRISNRSVSLAWVMDGATLENVNFKYFPHSYCGDPTNATNGGVISCFRTTNCTFRNVTVTATESYNNSEPSLNGGTAWKLPTLFGGGIRLANIGMNVFENMVIISKFGFHEIANGYGKIYMPSNYVGERTETNITQVSGVYFFASTAERDEDTDYQAYLDTLNN